jgi:hypothetical protein
LPFARVWRGLILLGITFAAAVCAYCAAGYPWTEGVWMVAITISSVGISDRSQQPPAVQLLRLR